jgi:hypothetical protein
MARAGRLGKEGEDGIREGVDWDSCQTISCCATNRIDMCLLYTLVSEGSKILSKIIS